jgi:hypothetical protein
MRRPPTNQDSVQLPVASALSMCDGLFRMASCLITELPEAELRDVRDVLDSLSLRVDRLLDQAEHDLSLSFDGLAIDPGKFYRHLLNASAPVSPPSDIHHYPDGEDFGAATASNSVTANTSGPTFTPQPRHHQNMIGRVPVPTSVPTPVPSPAQAPVLAHGSFPLIISSRHNVGLPDYKYHPKFIRPGLSFVHLTTQS